MSSICRLILPGEKIDKNITTVKSSPIIVKTKHIPSKVTEYIQPPPPIISNAHVTPEGIPAIPTATPSVTSASSDVVGVSNGNSNKSGDATPELEFDDEDVVNPAEIYTTLTRIKQQLVKPENVLDDLSKSIQNLDTVISEKLTE